MHALVPQPHQALIQAKLPPWFIKASAQQRLQLTQSMAISHLSRARLAESLEGIQGLLEFSRPLLAAALDNEFGVGLDPERACFFHARFKREPLTGRQVLNGSSVQTLLQAALQNFEAKEAIEVGKETISAIYHCDPALQGEQKIEPASASPKTFIELCRRLDLGGRYQRYLESKLALPDIEQMKTICVNRERDVLRVEVHIAYMTKMISEPFYEALLSLDTPGVKPTLRGKPLGTLYFKMLGVNLRGVIVFQASSENPCVVYMPSQPSTPLKEYANFGEFMHELRENARTTQYRRYLRQLIPLRSRALFFSRLEDCLHPYVTRTIPGSTGLIKPRMKVRVKDLRANLWLDKRDIGGTLSDYFYAQHMLHIKDDARVLAVPTDDENEKARKERLAGFFEYGMSVLNLASFVLPGLGEAMLLMAGSQWLVEIFEGVDAWTHGQMTEALEHLSSVAQSIAVAAILAKAGTLAARGVPPIKPSPFIDGMVPARSREGGTRLRHTAKTLRGPVFKMPTRLPDGRLGYLLSGRGRGATIWHTDPRQNLINAMTALFPEAAGIQVHVGGLLAFGETLEALIASTQQRLEDYQLLRSTLDAWTEPAPDDLPAGTRPEPISAQARQTRRTFAEAICQAWRYSHVDAPRGPDILLLESVNLAHVVDLPDLPAHYNQIRYLTLRNVIADSEQLNGLLRRFEGVTSLAMVGGGLRALPAGLAGLNHLYNLSIEGQGLTLDQHAMNLLMDIPRLSTLNLSGNTLGEFSDTARLRLNELTLNDTGLTQWPHWVDVMNLRELDISNNHITALPTAVTDNPLDPFHHTIIFAHGNPINIEDLRSYWLHSGYGRAFVLEFDFPEEIRVLSPLGSGASQGSTSSLFGRYSHASSASGSIATQPAADLWLMEGRSELNSRLLSAWGQVQQGNDALHLMILLQRLQETADFQQFREELANDVLTVLEAASADTTLRGQLEIMANDRLFGPDQTCQDGARLIFSDIQVAVYAHTALSNVPTEQQTERLFGVIRNMFRLNQVQSIADLDIARQLSNGVQVDQAEVRLAYRIGLASHLALPGQPLRMVWGRLSNVGAQAILDARRLVLEREAGPEFLQFAVSDQLWNARLRAEHAVELEQATVAIRAEMEALEERPPVDPDDYHRQGVSLIARRDAAEQALLEQVTSQYRQAWH